MQVVLSRVACHSCVQRHTSVHISVAMASAHADMHMHALQEQQDQHTHTAHTHTQVDTAHTRTHTHTHKLTQHTHTLHVHVLHFGRSIASWFDERGVLHKDKLHEDLSALQYDVKHKKGQ